MILLESSRFAEYTSNSRGRDVVRDTRMLFCRSCFDLLAMKNRISALRFADDDDDGTGLVDGWWSGNYHKFTGCWQVVGALTDR
jgi:hypothetical protein